MATHSFSLMPFCISADAMENQKPNVAVPLRFLRFPDGRTTEAYFQVHIPSEYASAPVLRLIYDTEDGETGDIRVTAEVMAVSDGELANADSFDTANAANAASLASRRNLITTDVSTPHLRAASA